MNTPNPHVQKPHTELPLPGAQNPIPGPRPGPERGSQRGPLPGSPPAPGAIQGPGGRW